MVSLRIKVDSSISHLDRGSEIGNWMQKKFEKWGLSIKSLNILAFI